MKRVLGKDKDRVSKAKILGTKFEVWMEKLLSELGYNVERHIIRYKGSAKRGNTYREIDLEIFGKRLGFIPIYTILELKYSSNGKIRLNHRGVNRSKEEKESTIDNLVSELDERKHFVRANHAVLVTNDYFTDEVIVEAGKYGIELWDRDVLESKDRKRASLLEKLGLKERASIEEQVSRIRFKREYLKPTYRKVGDKR